jgi:hypothetical protein
MKVGQSSGEDGRIVSPEAFEAVFRLYYVPVYRFIAGRVGTALAEDLAAATQVYTSPSAMTGRPRKVALVGLDTGNPLMGIRGTHVVMT